MNYQLQWKPQSFTRAAKCKTGLEIFWHLSSENESNGWERKSVWWATRDTFYTTSDATVRFHQLWYLVSIYGPKVDTWWFCTLRAWYLGLSKDLGLLLYHFASIRLIGTFQYRWFHILSPINNCMRSLRAACFCMIQLSLDKAGHILYTIRHESWENRP